MAAERRSLAGRRRARAVHRRRAAGRAADGRTALAWTAALAALSLFLVNPNADDSEYVHLSSWVAAHGSFPVGDTLFSDQTLPAIFFPPLNSYEALVGAFAHTTELPGAGRRLLRGAAGGRGAVRARALAAAPPVAGAVARDSRCRSPSGSS